MTGFNRPLKPFEGHFAELIYEEALQPPEELLVLAIRSRRSLSEHARMVELFGRVGRQEAHRAARRNHVEALAGSGLRQVLSDADLGSAWSRLLDGNERRVVAQAEALKAVLNRIPNDGRCATMESAGVLFSTSLPPAGFDSGDFDVLADERGWPALCDALKMEGFEPMTRTHGTATRVLFVRRRTGGPALFLNVARRSFNRSWAPLLHEVRDDAWLVRREPAAGWLGIPVLRPSDLLAQVAIHTSIHSYVRPPGLRLHVDVDRLVSESEVSWRAFLDEVKAMQLPTRAFVSLSMAAGLLGTPVPEWVLRSLYPGDVTWGALRGLLGRDRVCDTGRPKLPAVRAVALELLLRDRPLVPFAVRTLVPSDAWMRDHFGCDGTDHPMWQLHLERYRQAASFLRKNLGRGRA